MLRALALQTKNPAVAAALARKDGIRGGQFLLGRVVSDRMQKTVIVAVDHIHKNHKYGVYFKTTSRIFAHDESQLSRCRASSTMVHVIRRR